MLSVIFIFEVFSGIINEGVNAGVMAFLDLLLGLVRSVVGII